MQASSHKQPAHAFSQAQAAQPCIRIARCVVPGVVNIRIIHYMERDNARKNGTSLIRIQELFRRDISLFKVESKGGRSPVVRYIPRMSHLPRFSIRKRVWNLPRTLAITSSIRRASIVVVAYLSLFVSIWIS